MGTFYLNFQLFFLFFTLVKAEVFTVAAMLKALAHTTSKVGVQSHQNADSVNNVFSNHFGIF